MRKPEVNFAIDTLAFFLFLCLVSTGSLIYFVMPPASGLSVWGMDRHGWGDIHFWIAISFLLLMAIHFILHWNWIKQKVRGKSNDEETPVRRSFFAIILVVIVLFLLIAPFLSPVEKTSGGGHGRQIEQVEIR